MAANSQQQESAKENAGTKRRKVSWAFWCSLTAIAVAILVVALPQIVARAGCGKANICIVNLKMIDGAIQQWAFDHHTNGAAMVTTTDILMYLKGNVMPVCPKGGTYSVSVVSNSPTCTITRDGHSL